VNKIVLQLCKEDLIFQTRERHCWKFLFSLLPPSSYFTLRCGDATLIVFLKQNGLLKFFGFLLEAEYCNKAEKDILTSASMALG